MQHKSRFQDPTTQGLGGSYAGECMCWFQNYQALGGYPVRCGSIFCFFLHSFSFHARFQLLSGGSSWTGYTKNLDFDGITPKHHKLQHRAGFISSRWPDLFDPLSHDKHMGCFRLVLQLLASVSSVSPLWQSRLTSAGVPLCIYAMHRWFP